MILSGLDEAALGPTLGPFCAALVEFESGAFDTADPNLYEILSDTVSRDFDGSGRFPAGDSKVLYSPSKGLGVLESSVTAFLAAADLLFPISFAGLITALCPPEDAESLHTVPWFAGAESFMLPISEGAPRGEGAPKAHPGASLAAALAEKGVAIHRPAVRFVAAGAFNRALRDHGGKGGAVQSFLTPLLKKALPSAEGAAGAPHEKPAAPRTPEPVTASPRQNAHERQAAGRQGATGKSFFRDGRRVTVDRQGGRRYYGEWLAAVLPGAPLRAIEEGPVRSVYTFGAGSIEFTVGADGLRLETALASMIAKYVREAAMTMFNRWWSERVPGLRPTAGYPQDAKRFLKDLAAAEALPAERDLLVRRL